MVERLLALAPTDATSLYSAACSYAHAGHHQRALDLLERRLEVGQIHRDWVAQDPDFDSLRDDPRFIAMLQRMGEPPPGS
jgi:adenylate cyclase